MSGVVSWLTGSLWGTKPSASTQQQHQDDTMRDDEDQHRSAASRNPNDDTINYDEMDEEDDRQEQLDYHDAQQQHAAASSSSSSHRAPNRNSSTATSASSQPSQHQTPAVPHRSASSFATPATHSSLLPFTSPSISPTQRLSFGSPGHTATFSFGNPTPAAGVGMTPLSFTPRNAAAPSTVTAASSSPDALLRSALNAFEARQVSQASAFVEQLRVALSSGSASDTDIDQLVRSLARRVGDSRHLHTADGASSDDISSNSAAAILTSELRDKQRRFGVLLAFLKANLLQRGSTSLWNSVNYTTRYTIMQVGELIECAIALKTLLNTAPATLRKSDDPTSTDVVVNEHDAQLVNARRTLASDCMNRIVQARIEGPTLLREGLSAQDIYFSETSRIQEIFAVLEQRIENDSKHAFSVVQSIEMKQRLNAAAEIVHALFSASAAFRAREDMAVYYSDLSLPNTQTNEMILMNWILNLEVRKCIKTIITNSVEVIELNKPSASSASSSTSSTVSAASTSQYNIALFEHIYISTRVFLQAYTEVLEEIEVLRQQLADQQQQQGDDLPAEIAQLEETLHNEFVQDRSALIQALTTASAAINAQNLLASSVFPIPPQGLPGVPPVHQAPYQPLYELSQEFQDYGHLVSLALKEERSISDRRMIFFLVHYGYPFLVQLFEDCIAKEMVARLLELSSVAAVELPQYVAECHARNEACVVRDSAGDSVEIAADGSLNGVPLYDAWLSQLLKAYPKYAWLHELQMEQYDDASKLLRLEAKKENDSLESKKMLLSLSKLALLASGAPSSSSIDENGGGHIQRSTSDQSLMSTSSEASIESSINSNELQSINDELSVLLAQQFLQVNAAAQDASGEEEEKQQAVLPPKELVQQLLENGMDKSQPTLIRVHSFCFAFDILEKQFLPKPRTTSFERFSRENQDALLQVWRKVMECDMDDASMSSGMKRVHLGWKHIAQLKQHDSSDAWESHLPSTMLYQVWRELLKPDLRCYQHEDVYTHAFQQLLTTDMLPSQLQTNEVRVVLEQTMRRAKQQS